jgi:hypothetical protein
MEDDVGDCRVLLHWRGIPVEHGLWVYCDYQPLWVWKGTAPPVWSVLNATCMLTSATLMLVALPYLKGAAQLLLVPLAASGAYMGHMGAGFPMYNAMNANVPHWVIDLAGAISIGMAMAIIWICTIVLTYIREQLQRPSALRVA